MKALKPSHREHKRYLLISGADANSRVIDEALVRFLGVLGYAKATPMFVKDNSGKASRKGKLILSVNRQELENVKAGLVFSGKDLRVERVSGAINGLD
jgi:RNase P/RNase MRP subunit POP5